MGKIEETLLKLGITSHAFVDLQQIQTVTVLRSYTMLFWIMCAILLIYKWGFFKHLMRFLNFYFA